MILVDSSVWIDYFRGDRNGHTMQLDLLERKGNLGFYLAFCEDYEKANWQRIAASTARLGLNEEKVSHLYLAATTWVNQQLQAMEGMD